MHVLRRFAVLALLALGANGARAAVLAEDRADLMYHRYQGGGITVDGPSVLVRKKFGESLAATANYYIDNITSASIDVVVSGASRYAERREQKSLALEYLRGKTTYSASYTNSKENDYRADTYSLSVSQDMFGDLTTVSFGYAQGLDKIGSSVDPTFADEIERRNYRLGVTQVLTRDLLASFNFETVTEQGYLQNPYRFMRFLNAGGTYSRGPEIFPRTRTSNAGSLMLKYYLPWRAAVQGQYRFYTDTWGINAHTGSLEYTHPLWNRWVFSGSYRYYTQTGATFWSDLFPRDGYQNFMARDKENSPLATHTIGIGASYEFPVEWAGSWLQKGSANLRVNHMMVDYSRFRDLRDFPPGTATPGTEPLYALDANFLTFYVSFFF
ncbi:MAG: DUF3570 domain-containing protein [Gammaproteobacteria bacterium]|nr:DUF3570 domain-containing protein [Gammaproteobacteria bacterium]